MGDLIASTKNLPAHLAQLHGADTGDWESGTTGGFPVISTKGKVFTIRRGDETEVVMRPDEEDEPAGSLQVVILKTHHGAAKTYFEGTYEEGSDDKPTCYSPDGIAPAADAEDRQANKCAICPRNQWGSRITDSGKKAKQCSDVKRLAVAPGGQVNDPMLLRVPPTSLKAWDQYVAMLSKRGLTPAHVITKVSFDPTVAHQLLIFKVVDFITEDMVPLLEEALADPNLDAIIGSDVGHAPEEEDDTPPPAPKPKAKAKAKRKAKAAPAAEDTADDDGAEDEGELVDDTPPPPSPKAKRKPAKKAKPEPAPEPEEPEEDDDDLVEDEEEDADDDFGDLDFDDLDFDD